MSDREELRRRRRETGLDTAAQVLSFASPPVGARHNRCDGPGASPRCFALRWSPALRIMLTTNSAQVSAIFRIAAPAASAVARAWGLF